MRLRLTRLYGGLFLVSGAVLLLISNSVAFAHSSITTSPGGVRATAQTALARAQAHIQELQTQLDSETARAHGILSHDLLLGSLIALCVMTVLSAALGWYVAGRVLRPLQDMTAATQRISEDNLDERLALPGPGDELKDLADTIDGLLERLEGAFAAQRRFVANASHELRTPLTTMRASLDVAVAKPVPVPEQTIALAGRLRTELDRVDGLLDGFLALARAQHDALPGRQVLALADVVDAILATRADAIAARRLVVRHTAAAGGWVEGSKPLLSRMVENVIDNAIKHNTDGGWIGVGTGTGRAGQPGTATSAGQPGTATSAGPPQTAWLAVETGGQVLDQAQVDQLSQPFRRLGADRTGSDSGAGLGLSIVAAIAAAHGGILDLRARPQGGLRVSIELPLARQPAGTGVPA